MKITHIISLLGGLALFLYGMQMMSAGMEAAAGNRIKKILEKLTANRFLGVAVGAGITAIIQSSSATTVMVVGFVNSGMMTLRQAVWIIMGANIGTTITGQMIALDAGAIAPFIAFTGVVLIMFVKRPKVHHIGNILAGLGILFIGMDMMSNAMMPLRHSPVFIDLMTKFKNPLLGILAGMIFTAIIQSSSASVGILQALAGSGVIPFSSAVFVLFGQNIGTCITAVLASIGTSRNAKRTTIIHLSFNIIGTAIFTTLCLVLPITNLVASWTPGNSVSQIANMHTTFNIATTLLLIPFGNYLAKFAEKLLPDTGANENDRQLIYLQNNVATAQIGVTAMNIEQVQNEMKRMLGIAKTNVQDSFSAFIQKDISWIPKVTEREETVDYLNLELSHYISRVITHEADPKGSEMFSAYYKIIGNIERISDHAMNVCGYSNILKEMKVNFSEEEQKEVQCIQDTCSMLLETLFMQQGEVISGLTQVAALEQKIDDMTASYRNNMINRMKTGECSQEGCILYSEMLTDFERIGDHALNISEELAHIQMSIE